MKIYHISDLHLGVKPTKGSEVEHTNLVIRNLEKLIKKAENENVPFILIAGDIFDSNSVSQKLVDDFFNLLKIHNSINFILIPGGGNEDIDEITGHDAYTSNSVYKRIDVITLLKSNEHITLLTPETPFKTFDDAAFYAKFFGKPENFSFSPDKKHHIGIFHGAYGNREDYNEINLNSFPYNEFSYIALGHYHTFKKVSDNAFYSGAFIQFEYIANKEAKSGYVEVDLEDNLKVKYVEIEDAPKFLSKSILSEKDVNEIKELKNQHLNLKIVSYLEDYENFVQNLKEELGDRLEIVLGAKLERKNIIIADVLEKLISKNILEEYREDVKEIILYGLQVTTKKRDFENYLIEKFNLNDGGF